MQENRLPRPIGAIGKLVLEGEHSGPAVLAMETLGQEQSLAIHYFVEA